MTATHHMVRPLAAPGDARHCLEALHFHGFTVTIHSPKTSPNHLYAVTAYGSRGRKPEMLRGADEHLDAALKAVAVQLGGVRLKAYATRALTQQAGGAA